MKIRPPPFAEVPPPKVALGRFSSFFMKFMLSLGVGTLGVPLVALIHDLTGGFEWMFLTLGGFATAIVLSTLLLPAGKERKAPLPLPGAPPYD